MNTKRIKDISSKVLSHYWGKLQLYTFQYKMNDGNWIEYERELYDKGDGAAVLLYNVANKSVVLTRQLRMPAFVRDSNKGMQIEVCAGLLDGDSPENCVTREAEEECGYKLTSVKKVYETLMSPGAVVENMHLFIAQYDRSMKVSDGGGLAEENEDIEVLELLFDTAYSMISSGEIQDAKTILLLQYAKIHDIFEIGV